MVAPEAKVRPVEAYGKWVGFYLGLIGSSLGSAAWLMVWVDRKVLSRWVDKGDLQESAARQRQGPREPQHPTQRGSTALAQQVQRQEVQLQKALTYAATLRRITEKVRDSLEEDEILQTTVRELATRLKVLGCNVGLYSLERGISTITHEFGAKLPSQIENSIQIEEHRGLYNRLLAGESVLLCQMPSIHGQDPKEPLLCLVCPIFDRLRQKEAEALYLNEYTQPVYLTRSTASAEKPAIFGDLWLFKRADQEFSEAEIRLVQQVATQCAIGLRQACLYKALQSQVAELESLHRLKDDFLSTISHELRTPMSNIKMSLYMIRQTQDEERRQGYLNILESECTREIELINDLLDLQRLEAGVEQPRLEVVDLARWIPAQLRSFEARLTHYRQTLQVQWDPALQAAGAQLWTDSQRLARILGELLNNACKYTAPGGEIRLSVTLQVAQSTVTSSQLAEPENPYIRFEVSNPAEIPADQLPRLFDKFYRVPSGDPWKRGGTGLGLALVKKSVEQLGGKVGVISQGGMTTFWFLLPQNPFQPDPESAPTVTALPQP